MAIKIEQKPRERAYRRWLVIARIFLWAPPFAGLVVFVLAFAGWLPEWWTHTDRLMALTGPLYAVCIGACFLATRRFNQMTKEWGHRKAVSIGFVLNYLAKDANG